MRILAVVAGLTILVSSGCGGGGGKSSGTVTPPAITVSITPSDPEVSAGVNQTFQATVTGTANTLVLWTIQEGSAGGAITAQGIYNCSVPGTYHVTATSSASLSGTHVSATTSVTVIGGNVNGTIQ